MLDAILGKFVLFVLGLIKPDYETYVHLLKDWHVVFWSERAVPVGDI